jgi:transcription initiation factor IIF auxiliary subunit
MRIKIFSEMIYRIHRTFKRPYRVSPNANGDLVVLIQ